MAQNSAIYKAETLKQKGDIAGAAATLEEALRNPKTTNWAEMYHQAGELRAQLFNVELMKAAQGMPFDTTAFVTHLDSMVFLYTKSHEADIAPDKKGKVKPKFVAQNHARMSAFLDYYNYAALFMNQNKQLDRSMLYFEKYLDMPKNPIFTQHETDSIYASKQQVYSQTVSNLAMLSFQQKKWDDALRFADRALKDTMNLRDLYVIKMQCHVNKGDSAAWLETLKEGVTRLENESMMQNLLYYYMTHNDLAAATKMADDLVAANPSNRSSWYMKGVILLNMKKDYQSAREAFTKALEIDPNYIEANINMASTYINEVVAKRLAGSYKFAGTGKNITGQKNVDIYKKELAEIQGYYKNAQKYMEHVQMIDPENPKRWVHTLQMIYDNLQLKDKKAEMDAIIESL